MIGLIHERSSSQFHSSSRPANRSILDHQSAWISVCVSFISSNESPTVYQTNNQDKPAFNAWSMLTPMLGSVRRIFRRMRNPVFRITALILSAFLFTAAPVQAGPVVINDVIQVLSTRHAHVDLKLRSLELSSRGVIDASAVQPARDAQSHGIERASLVAFDEQKPGVVTVEQGDVQGTICDCGEIPIAAVGFPKWPFLFLAGIPLFFIHSGDSSRLPPPSTPEFSPQPSPVPPVSAVPEPAPLLLFGTALMALAAQLRRRHKTRITS